MSGSSQTIACPVCDTMYCVDDEIATRSTRCLRCGHRLTYGNLAAIGPVVGPSLTSLILLVIAMHVPFLELSSGGRSQETSLIEVVSGFNHGIMLLLGFAVLGFIVVLPLTRFFLLLLALGPLVLGRTPLPGGPLALRWATHLKPWAMAEVFMFGVAAALVKLSGLATTNIGPGFWILAAVVLLTAYQETLMCRHTLWTELNRARA